MPVIARVIFGCMQWAARNGFAESTGAGVPNDTDAKRQARQGTGMRGETFAYWYLRRHGYIIIARNFTVPGVKGEIDLIGYDGAILSFVEVKTRTGARDVRGLPEDAVTPEKRRHICRMARQFLAEWHLRKAQYRFDVIAIESCAGSRP